MDSIKKIIFRASLKPCLSQNKYIVNCSAFIIIQLILVFWKFPPYLALLLLISSYYSISTALSSTWANLHRSDSCPCFFKARYLGKAYIFGVKTGTFDFVKYIHFHYTNTIECLVSQTLNDVLTGYVGLHWIFDYGFEIISHLQQFIFTFIQSSRLMSIHYMHRFCSIHCMVIFNAIE